MLRIVSGQAPRLPLPGGPCIRWPCLIPFVAIPQWRLQCGGIGVVLQRRTHVHTHYTGFHARESMTELEWKALPEYTPDTLTFDIYEGHARRQEPFALVGLLDQWPAARNWMKLSHFSSHPDVEQDQEVDVAIHPRPFDLCAEQGQVPLSQALELLSHADAEGDDPPSTPMYMKWAISHCPTLVDELPFRSFYTKVPRMEPASMPLLLRPGHFYCWVYIGQAGSGSATHIDIVNSSAWLLMLRGKKEWLLANGKDLDLLTSGGDKYVDLFAARDSYSEDPSLQHDYPDLPRATLYRYTQQPGTAIFVPSRCLHAVRNLAFSVSVTHNFVDSTNQEHWEAAIKDMLGEA
eukprot:Sspe_Gene.19569::Locus_7143_Transcript_2_2_Confidence_0.750_Length_14972::g.19569::m.19569